MAIGCELVVVVVYLNLNRSLQMLAVAVDFEVAAVTSEEMFYLPALVGLD